MKSLISMLLLLPLAASCATPSKRELDAEVNRLCAIDGGIKVYETVNLSELNLDKQSAIKIPAREDAKPQDKYYYEREISYYRKGNPEVSRSQHKIVRRSDGKVLGEAVRYARGGGDLLGPWHDSTYICPEPTNTPNLEESIFLIRNGK